MEFREEEEEEDKSKLGDGYMEELIFAFAVAIAVAFCMSHFSSLLIIITIATLVFCFSQSPTLYINCIC